MERIAPPIAARQSENSVASGREVIPIWSNYEAQLATASTTHFQHLPLRAYGPFNLLHCLEKTMATHQTSSIDIAGLKRDILDKDPTHALPANMSDFWLSAINDSLERIFECAEWEAQDSLAAPLALILHLLAGKSFSNEITLTNDTFLQYLNDYRTEVALELVRRITNVPVTPATLDTIFTDRNLNVDRQLGKRSL